MGMEVANARDGGRLKDIRACIDSLYGHDLHAKRVDSLAVATLCVMTGASLAVAMIDQALAARQWRQAGVINQGAKKRIFVKLEMIRQGGGSVWWKFHPKNLCPVT
jgi:hypothetical protein